MVTVSGAGTPWWGHGQEMERDYLLPKFVVHDTMEVHDTLWPITMKSWAD